MKKKNTRTVERAKEALQREVDTLLQLFQGNQGAGIIPALRVGDEKVDALLGKISDSLLRFWTNNLVLTKLDFTHSTNLKWRNN